MKHVKGKLPSANYEKITFQIVIVAKIVQKKPLTEKLPLTVSGGWWNYA